VIDYALLKENETLCTQTGLESDTFAALFSTNLSLGHESDERVEEQFEKLVLLQLFFVSLVRIPTSKRSDCLENASN
jgi:hypothetical protein